MRAGTKEARRCIEPNHGFWLQLAQFEQELEQRRQQHGHALAAEPACIDAEWVRRSVARFAAAPADVGLGLPSSASSVCLAIRCGVDCWLGRGCDPATGRWLEAFAVHSVGAGGRGSAACEGALTGLRETLLSSDFMVDWACEISECTRARAGRRCCAAARSVRSGRVAAELWGDKCNPPLAHEGLRIVRTILNAVCTV